MQVLDEVYGEAYQKGSIEPKMVAACEKIADALYLHFRPRTFCDVGCGGGSLIRGMERHSVYSCGIEGSQNACTLHPNIIHHDLREPWNKDLNLPNGGADLVYCTDVGEHIESEGHPNFVHTIRQIMAPGGALVFGAAGEGQEGLGHVACAHPCYWIALFEEEGLKLCAKESEDLRSQIRQHEEHAHAWWVVKNLFVMRERRR